MNRVIWIVVPVAVAVALAACDHHHDHDHDHGHTHEHKAPHGGALVVVGDPAAHFAHLEFVLDQVEGKLTAYVLDGEAEKGVRIAQETIAVRVKAGDAEVSVSLEAQERAATGEKKGDASEFVGRHDALKGLARFDGVVERVEIKGKAFTDVAFKYPEGNE